MLVRIGRTDVTQFERGQYMKKSIKIVHFVPRLVFGGVEAVILNYVNHFECISDFEFHIITQDINSNDCLEQFKKNGFIVHIVTHKRKSIFKNIVEIYHILKKEKFDIVHSHMTLTNFYVLFLSHIVGTRVRISHSHNVFGENTNLVKRYVVKVIKIMNRLTATDYMSCSRAAGEYLFGKRNVNCGKVYLLKNAINLKKFIYNQDVRQRIRKKYGICDNDFCVGNIGRFANQKNQIFLISVFFELAKLEPNSKLLLVGDGELKTEIISKVNELKISEKVIFVGQTTTPYHYYQAMDIFCFPSLYEGLGIVAIEAQARGIPVLASDILPKEVAVTSLVEFCSLKEEPLEWARKLINLRKKECINSLEKLKEYGYSIEKEAKKLEVYYKEKYDKMYNDK